MRHATKTLRFPLLGVAGHLAYGETTFPDENRAYATPDAMNVRGTCTFGERSRGGSRPGLKRLSGVSSASAGAWHWPNGNAMTWPGGGAVTINLPTTKFSGPDGAPFVNPHQPYTPMASKGAVPSGVRAMAWYRYRLFVSKNAQWYASRSGAVTDWDYGGDMEDVSRAATGSVAQAGIEGETITAMMPVLDRFLYIATERDLWCLAGEPTNGKLACVAPGVGCIGPDAWCFDGRHLWIYSPRGVFALTPGETGPVLFSDKLPAVKATDGGALMATDNAGDGVLLFSTDGDWFIDPAAKAMWPMSVPSTMRPVAMAHVVVSHGNVTAMLGSDGKWRYFDDAQAADDFVKDVSAGTEIASRVVIGPFRCSADDMGDGILGEVYATTGEGSADVTVKFAFGRSAEGALAAYRAGTFNGGTHVLKAGWNNVFRPRARGAWGVMVLSSSGRWAYETARVLMKQLGRLRV